MAGDGEDARAQASLVLENPLVTATSPSTSTFEALRGRLFGLAYRMLGSRAEAEDAAAPEVVPLGSRS